MNVLRSFRSEWLLLNRRRLWVGLGVTTVLFTAVATMLSLSNVRPAARTGGVGLVTESLHGSGGATAAVVFAVTFSAILVVAAFASSTGNEFARGTLRAALTTQPNRWSLITGKLAARVSVAAILMLSALLVGAVTARTFAPSRNIDTTGWLGTDALGDGIVDYGRLLAFIVVYALIATTIAVLVRSTPIALGIGLLWFGPFENVVGDDRAWAQRWLPGLLLRSVLQPDAPTAIGTATALATLGIYAVICAAVIAAVMSRRDITS